MIRLRLRGVTPLFALVCAFAFPGAASAGVSEPYQECTDPNDVPDLVLSTIVQCKDDFKSYRQEGRDDIDQLRDYNLGRCSNDFEISLYNICLGGVI